jgi:hypothetical protein
MSQVWLRAVATIRASGNFPPLLALRFAAWSAISNVTGTILYCFYFYQRRIMIRTSTDYEF